MPFKLNVIDREGNQTTINVEEGITIKDAIEDELSPDNYGVCGGCCACGTCHVYVKASDIEKLSTKEDDEITTLESLALEPSRYSRLGCQVQFKKEYDNIYKENKAKKDSVSQNFTEILKEDSLGVRHGLNMSWHDGNNDYYGKIISITDNEALIRVDRFEYPFGKIKLGDEVRLDDVYKDK